MTKLSKVIALVLGMVLSIPISAQTVWDGKVATSFAGGNGTQSSPYLIATPQQLAYLRSLLFSKTQGKYYALTADICLNQQVLDENGELTEVPVNEWTYDETFGGVFDGRNHTISGLFLARHKLGSSNNQAGLFSMLGENGVVKNLSIVDSYVCADNAGLVVGQALNGYTLQNVMAQGTVESEPLSPFTTYSSSGIGGLVGYQRMPGEISNCCFVGRLINRSNNKKTAIGGLVGCMASYSNYSANIPNGLPTIKNCYSSVKIDYRPNVCSWGAGGVFGTYEKPSANNTWVPISSFPFENVYFNHDHCAYANGEWQYTLYPFTAPQSWEKTTEEMGTEAFAQQLGEDFVYEEGYYPHLKGHATRIPINALAIDNPRIVLPGVGKPRNIEPWDGTIAESFAGGNGTASNPYLISNACELALMQKMITGNYNQYGGACYKLTNDIIVNQSVLTAAYERDTLDNFAYTPPNFKGTFDGDYHTISGLKIYRRGENSGFFGFVTGGAIKNVALVDVYVTGLNDDVNNKNSDYIGIIAGQTANGTIVENCFVQGWVGGYNSCIGGIVGKNSATIRNCYAFVRVTGKGAIGGITGYANTRSPVSNCYVVGTVMGKSGKNVGAALGLSFSATNIFANSDFSSKPIIGLQNDIATNVESKSTQEMSSPEFASQLGEAFVYAEGYYPYIPGLPRVRIDGTVEDPLQRPTFTIEDNEGNQLRQGCNIELGESDASLTKKLVLTNTGKTSLELTLNTTEGLFSVTPATTTLAPGGNQTITIELDASRVTSYGRQRSTLTIEAEGQHPLTYQLKGNILPPNEEELTVWDGTIATSYAGGTGTETDPYLIANGQQLALLAQETNEAKYNKVTTLPHFKLINDIVLNEHVLGDGYELNGTPYNKWTPIGIAVNGTTQYFWGVFDGNYHTISGVYVPSGTYAGLFGIMRGIGFSTNDHNKTSIIRNLIIRDSYISGGYAGGIIGSVSIVTTIENCFVEASVNCPTNAGQSGGAASIVGLAAERALIRNCYTIGAVRSPYTTAGLAYRSNVHATIQNCFTVAQIDSSASSKAGIVDRTTFATTDMLNEMGTFSQLYFNNDVSPNTPVINTMHDSNPIDTVNACRGASTEEMTSAAFAKTLGSAFAYEKDYYPYIPGLPKIKADGTISGTAKPVKTITLKEEETGNTIKAEVSEPEEEGEEPTATVTEVELAEGQTAIVVPDSINGFVVNEIGEGFAKDNKDITEVVLPEVISTIGEEAFSGCENIQGEMDLTNVTEIGNGAFHDCIGIEEFHFGQDAENITIGEGAFTQTTLEGKEVVLDADIYIPAGQRDEYREKFGKEEGDPLYPYFQEESEKIFEEFKDEESGMEFVGKVDTEGNGSWSITDGTTVEGNYEVPEQIFDEPIVGIGDGAFKDNMALTGVELNNKIKFIGDDAFNGCENLTGDVDLGNVTEIGDNAFQGCDGIKEFNFGQNAAELNIGKGAFTKIVIDENSGEQQEQALNAEIILPPTQREDFRDKFGGEIGKPLKPYFDLESEKVFEEYKPEDGTEFKGSIDLEGQSSWTLIDGSNYAGDLVAPHTLFEEPVVGIGDGAFKDNMALTGVELNNRIRFIGDDAFNGCENIQDEVVLESSMSIGDYAFNDCNKLDDIIIKEKAENMQFGRYPFCKDLAAMARAQAPEAGTVPEPLNARIFVPVGELENYRTRFAQTEQDPLWPNFQIDKVFEGDPTGIYAIGLPGNQKAANTVYDLQGRKISNQTYSTTNLPKGIYIINGKKMVK